MSTSNFELIDICKKLNLKLNGVYTKDKIPNQLEHGCYIINLQDLYDNNTGERNTGTHWTGLYIKKNDDKAFYFDSFGFPPPQIIIKILKKQNIKCQYSLKLIQNINSSTCGMYVISFLLYLYKKNYTFENFLKLFSEIPSQNNKILDEMLNEYSINIY